jgi:hypothetical protein
VESVGQQGADAWPADRRVVSGDNDKFPQLRAQMLPATPLLLCSWSVAYKSLQKPLPANHPLTLVLTALFRNL